VSRIEEALRRSGAAGPRPVPGPAGEPASAPAVPAPQSHAPEEHESPWTFEATAGAPSPGGTPAGPPALAPFQGFHPVAAEKLVVSGADGRGFVEEYRKLAASLHHTQADRGIKVVMIASALPGEGKSLTATNLALTLSESYRRRVLLIDADLRRPSLHEVFQVPNVSGLSDGLAAPSEHKLALSQITPLLMLLTAGKPEPDPMGAITSGRMRQVVEEASSAFDWVILDTPPVGLLTDANLLAAMVDAAVLVVRAGSTPLPAVQRAADAIGRDRLLGVVLNGTELSGFPSTDDYAYRYSYSYGYGYGGSSKPKEPRR
jgi:capsular exopolysaccharide synthesis family protein